MALENIFQGKRGHIQRVDGSFQEVVILILPKLVTVVTMDTEAVFFFLLVWPACKLVYCWSYSELF